MKNNELESEDKTNEGINAQSSESLSNFFLIHQKLTSIETKLSESINPIMLSIVELIKSVLLGWPALGIIFLLLFQDPIGKILEVLPKKLLSANEIGIAGLSLKSTIKKEAQRSGMTDLSKTLPTLSPGAIELLLSIEKILSTD